MKKFKCVQDVVYLGKRKMFPEDTEVSHVLSVYKRDGEVLTFPSKMIKTIYKIFESEEKTDIWLEKTDLEVMQELAAQDDWLNH
jgi:hypothetical protein